MARRRRRSPYRITLVFAVTIVAIAGYLMFNSNDGLAPEDAPTEAMRLAGVDQAPSPVPASPTHVVPDTVKQETLEPDFSDGLRLFESGQDALKRKDWVNARTQLSEALKAGLPQDKRPSARQALYELAQDLIFGPSRQPGDPLVDSYTVRSGDNLAKIARQYKVSADLLAKINRLPNKNVIRAGQNLKVVQGPFHAVIDKDAYEMYVYLQDTLVQHFAVGLGQEGSTPTGTWKIRNKLVNPTYHPPRGGDIIAADDPSNPLGERWLGLEGVSGEALGQQRYGIHGTIEPQSIGRNASLGCIRLHNEDIEILFDLLVTEHSRIEVLSR